MSDLTNNWSESYLKQSEFIDHEFKEFFSYLRQEYTSFKYVN